MTLNAHAMKYSKLMPSEPLLQMIDPS